MTKEQLEWCEKILPKDKWEVNSQGQVDVEGNVNLYFRGIENFPIQFGEVNGRFDCSGCEHLISLEGAPLEVTGSYDISWCKNLKSFKDISKIIGGHIDFFDIPMPEYIGKLFIDYNEDKIEWSFVYKILNEDHLSKAYNLGLI